MTLLVLLVASINYQLNLGYVLTFLLAGSGVVSMHVTHATLRGLTLHLKPVPPVFAGEPAVLDVVMTSPGSARYGIGLKMAAAADSSLAWIDVPAGGQATAQVSFVPPTRGLHDVPAITATTRFPLGLFRAWTVWRPAARLLVYPALERDAPRPPAARPVSGGAHAESQRRRRRDRRRARLPPRRPDEARRLEEGREGAGEPAATSSAATPRPRPTRSSGSTGPRAAAWPPKTGCRAWPPGRWPRTVPAPTTACACPALELAPADGDAQRRRCLEALALWK